MARRASTCAQGWVGIAAGWGGLQGCPCCDALRGSRVEAGTLIEHNAQGRVRASQGSPHSQRIQRQSNGLCAAPATTCAPQLLASRLAARSSAVSTPAGACLQCHSKDSAEECVWSGEVMSASRLQGPFLCMGGMSVGGVQVRARAGWCAQLHVQAGVSACRQADAPWATHPRVALAPPLISPLCCPSLLDMHVV